MARSRSGNRLLPRCRRGMMQVDFPYLVADRDRHGNARLYVRRYGRKIRIRKKLGTEAFALAYAEAIHALEQEGGRSEIQHSGCRNIANLLYRLGGTRRAC